MVNGVDGRPVQDYVPLNVTGEYNIQQLKNRKSC